jgi:hypothetical protein
MRPYATMLSLCVIIALQAAATQIHRPSPLYLI